MLKKLIGKLHLLLGLASGLVVFVVGITGAVYCWEEEIRDIQYDRIFTVAGERNNWNADSVFAVALKAHTGDAKPRFIRIADDAERSVEVGFRDKEIICVNPYTLQALGSYNRDTDFLGIDLQLHRRLMLGDTGEMITGISCLIFGFMLLSGIFLWWPRSKNIRKQRFRIALKAPKARKIFDLHSVPGFYASWILLFTVITGLVFSFKWFERTMYAVAGSEKKEIRFESPIEPKDSAFSLDAILLTEMRENPAAEEWFISLPDDSAGAIRVRSTLPREGFFKEENQSYYSQYSGEKLGTSTFSALSLGEKLRMSNYDIHTGAKFGIVGKLVLFFAALIAASLPVTGFLYWRIRLKAQKSVVR